MLLLYKWDEGYYAKFMLKIILQFLLGKTSVGLNLKIMQNSLHFGPEYWTSLVFK